jgi:hypothetical protein
MAGFSYAGGGGWTTCGFAEVPAFDGTQLLYGVRNPEKLRVWKWTGDHGEVLDTPLLVATNDDMVLHVLANAIERGGGL